MISLTYSASVQAALSEASTKTAWCTAIADTIGSNYKLVGRQSGTARITVQYSGAVQIISNEIVMDSDYDSLSIQSGTKELLVWRLESTDGEDWVEFDAPLNLTADPAAGQGLIFNPSVKLLPPANWPDGAELGWFGLPGSININVGSSYSLATHVSYNGGGTLTYTSVGTSLSGTGISLNSSTGVLSVSGGAGSGTVSGIQVEVTDGIETATSSTFSVVKQTSALSLNIPNLTTARGDKINLLSYTTYSGNTNNLTFTEVTDKLTEYLYIQNLTSQKRLWIAANSPVYNLTNVTIQVTDGTYTAQSTFNLIVNVDIVPLAWEGILSTMVRSRTGSFDLRDYVVYKSGGNLTFSSIGASLPAGVSLNSSTGRLTITSASVGTTSGLQFRATDGVDTEDSPVFSLQIVDEVLLYKDNISWTGAFRVPLVDGGGGDPGTFNYGGRMSSIDESGNGGAGSIFMTGYNEETKIGEISIPAIVNNPSNVNALNRATLLQSLVDPTEGTYTQVSGPMMQGFYTNGSTLIMSVWQYYGDSQTKTHWTRPRNLSNTGSVAGPKELVVSNYVDDGIPWHTPGTTWKPRSYGGYMGPIPAAWQTALGGSVLTGLGGIPTNSSSSNGPSAYSFDPSDMNDTNPKVNGLLAYPLDVNLAKQVGIEVPGDAWDMSSGSVFWNNSSEVRGVAFPEGTDSVLFLGDAGVGPDFWYGQGGAVPDPGTESLWGYDPYGNHQGNHCWPRTYVIWAYRAADLAAVHAGSKLHYEITPYAVWTFTVPWYEKQSIVDQGALIPMFGAAYRASTNQIYVSAHTADDSQPLIHVLDIDI